MENTTIFVSGATGFIALTLVKQLLEKGYSVIGSVRSTEKGEHLKRLLSTDKFRYEIIELIEKEGAFDKALQNHPDVTVFLHTASPFHFNTDSIEKDLLLPAIHGTENALKAIKSNGPQIRKVVLTSSLAANFDVQHYNDPNSTFNEKTWNPLTYDQCKNDPFVGYVGSKALAEKIAWTFIEEEKPNFTMNVVNPVYVFGPQAFEEQVSGQLNTSSEVINSLLKLSKDDKIPETIGYYIDVRDVAKAHITAFENDKITNERLLVSAGSFDNQDIIDIIHKNFPQLAEKLPKGNTDGGDTTNLMKLDTKRTRELLRFEYISLEKIIVDSVKQILDAQKK
ncbi:unnamed protein product [Debaryomyces tyrocola]|nr:unnamed protein product [Debaryomyces tyrocola]